MDQPGFIEGSFIMETYKCECGDNHARQCSYHYVNRSSVCGKHIPGKTKILEPRGDGTWEIVECDVDRN